MKRTTVYRVTLLILVSQLLPWAACWSSAPTTKRRQSFYLPGGLQHSNKNVKWTSISSSLLPDRQAKTTAASQLFMVDPWRESEKPSRQQVPIVLDGKPISSATKNETVSSSSTSSSSTSTSTTTEQTVDSLNSSSNNNNNNNNNNATTSVNGDTVNAQFGQVVPLKRPSSNNAAPDSLMDPFMPTKAAATTTTTTTTTSTKQQNDTASSAAADDDITQTIQTMKRRNLAVACLSIVLAVSNYLWQWLHPVTPVQLLASMQQSSAPLTVIGTNAKPTVVDFWAPWCDNCKLMAPTLQAIEQEYADRVNFILINGDDRDAWPVIEAFGVDAIPHLALVNAQGDVKTALIGPVPKRILSADLNVLLHNAATCGESSSTTGAASGAAAATTTSATTSTTTTKNDKETTAGTDQDAQSTSSSSSSSGSANICVEQPLPYTMLDVFEGRPPEQRRLRFTE